MLRVRIKQERENFIEPKKATTEAACFDAYISDIELKDDGMVVCKLGFSTEIPEGYKGVIVSRSNITKYGWILANGVGIIDSDYRGEWQARFRPLHCEDIFYKAFPYMIGDACCQIYFEEVTKTVFIMSEQLSETERGVGGFGHTDGK